MSEKSYQVRGKLSQAPLLIKQGNFISAVYAIREAIQTCQRKSLLRAEHEELGELIKAACNSLNLSKELRALFPLTIEYEAGKENTLLQIFDELIDILNSDNAKQVQGMFDKKSEEKSEEVIKGRDALEAGDYASARKTFAAIHGAYPKDTELASGIAEEFMKFSLYEDAVIYFQTVVTLAPNDSNALNRMGIALRKIKRFDLAEMSFLKALALVPGDPNLHFNLGRMYLDQKMWAKAMNCAEQAQSINPSFVEAGKMVAYCKKLVTHK